MLQKMSGLAVAVTFATAVVAGSQGAGSTGPAGVTATTIMMGMERDTGSFSADEENLGFRVAFEEVNTAGGIHGRRIETRSYARPSAADDAAVAGNARRLIDQDGVFALVNWGGPAAIPILALAAERKVPYLFPHSALVSSAGQRYLFTSFPRYEDEAALMFPYLGRERGLKKLGIVHDANAYGQLFLSQLGAMAAQGGYTVVGAVAVTEREPQDLTDGMRRLADAGADGIVLALYPAQAKVVVAAKRTVGWRGRLISVGPLTDEQYLNTPDGVAEGTVGFCYYPDPDNSDLPGVLAYRAAMAKAHPGRPLNRYSLYGYTFGRLIVEGLRRAGRDLSRERLIDAMETITAWDSGGVMPPVSFSRTDHHAQDAGFIGELEQGRFRAKSGWISRAAAQASPSAPPNVLANLEGRWQGSGTILGQASRVEMEWSPVLGGRFHRLLFTSHIGPEPKTRRFEGHAYYQQTPDGYRATWFDNSGLLRPIVATVEGNALVATWGTPETEVGETTYRVLEPGRMEAVDRVRGKDGAWREFGRSTLARVP